MRRACQSTSHWLVSVGRRAPNQSATSLGAGDMSLRFEFGGVFPREPSREVLRQRPSSPGADGGALTVSNKLGGAPLRLAVEWTVEAGQLSLAACVWQKRSGARFTFPQEEAIKMHVPFLTSPQIEPRLPAAKRSGRATRLSRNCCAGDHRDGRADCHPGSNPGTHDQFPREMPSPGCGRPPPRPRRHREEYEA